MDVVNGFKNGNKILKYNYNALENIPDDYTVFVEVVWPGAITGFNSPTYSMTAKDVAEAIQSGKEVKVKLGSISGGGVTSFQWIAPLVSFNDRVQYDHQLMYVFAVKHHWGDNRRSPCICIYYDGQTMEYSWVEDFNKVVEDVSGDLIWNDIHTESYINRVPMFDDNNSGGLRYNTVENIIDFGTTGAELVSAAWSGAETQKTTLSVVYGDGTEAQIIYGILGNRNYGATDLMYNGRGSILHLMIGTYNLYLRCVSGCYKGSSDDWWATFAGYLPTAVTYSDGTINEVKLYNITLDFYANKTVDSDDNLVYKAVATVSVEKIPSTIVPMT